MRGLLCLASLTVLALSLFGQTGTEAPRPPAGWKEYTPKDNAFTVWIPEKTKRQLSRERTSVIKGVRIKVTQLYIEMADGRIYQVEKLTAPSALTTKAKRAALEPALRDMLLSEFRAKLVEESDAKLGTIRGKEYLLETGKGQARARVFVGIGGRVVIMYVEGTKDQVQAKDTSIFLDSCKLGAAKTIAGGGGDAGKDKTRIVGGGLDPEFRDEAPPGGLLVGFEIGLGKFVNNDIIKSARPIFRSGDKDSVGKQHGTDTSRVIKVVAKPGYAVGAVTIKAGLFVDGMSVTFMKIENGALDPKDSYESDWLGGKGGGAPVRLAGTGAPVVGVIGRANNTDLSGLGLALRTGDASKKSDKK